MGKITPKIRERRILNKISYFVVAAILVCSLFGRRVGLFFGRWPRLLFGQRLSAVGRLVLELGVVLYFL